MAKILQDLHDIYRTPHHLSLVTQKTAKIMDIEVWGGSGSQNRQKQSRRNKMITIHSQVINKLVAYIRNTKNNENDYDNLLNYVFSLSNVFELVLT